jgi:hypothetical protein
MASEIRVNQIQNRSGLSTVTFSDSGVIIAGVTTVSTLSATNITGNLTGNVSGGTLTGISTLGVTTAYINTLSGISTISADAAVYINQNLNFASGKGIDFSATANSSGTMTSELLSDYEEGTFTLIASSTGAPGQTYSSTGRYRKVGSLVYFTVLVNSSFSGASGDYTASGLPFTSSSGADYAVSVGRVLYYSFTDPLCVAAYIPGNATSILIRRILASGSGDSAFQTDSNGQEVLVGGCYLAAS